MTRSSERVFIVGAKTIVGVTRDPRKSTFNEGLKKS
jgi:hypothetical protein